MEFGDLFLYKKSSSFRAIKKSPLKDMNHAKFCQFKSSKDLGMFWLFFAFEELDEAAVFFFRKIEQLDGCGAPLVFWGWGQPNFSRK